MGIICSGLKFMYNACNHLVQVLSFGALLVLGVMPEKRFVWLAAPELIDLLRRQRAEQVIAEARARGKVRRDPDTGELQFLVCLPLSASS